MALKVDYLQAGTYTAKDDRSAEGAALFSTGNLTWRSGVLLGNGADLKVTANGTPNMTVNVAVGQGICPCSGDAQSAPYTVTSDAITNLGIATANATNPRKDLVCLTVRDAFYSGANNDAILQVITGTAAPTPTLPATPSNSIALAEVDVAANATSITSGNIIDLRTYTVGRGGILPVVSTARPSAPYAGTQIFETDTKLIQMWDGTAWFPIKPGGPLGYIGGVQLTANSASTSAAAELQIASFTANVLDASRRIKLSMHFRPQATVAADLFAFRFRLTNITGTQLMSTPEWSVPAALLGDVGAFCIVPPGVLVAGTNTILATAQRQSGTGTLSVSASSTGIADFFAEDIGT